MKRETVLCRKDWQMENIQNAAFRSEVRGPAGLGRRAGWQVARGAVRAKSLTHSHGLLMYSYARGDSVQLPLMYCVHNHPRSHPLMDCCWPV